MLIEMLVIHWFFGLTLTACMLAVIVWDAARYIIPNALNAALILLYALAALLVPLDPLPALAAAGLMLVVGLGFFALGLMGGGDVKLLAALTLWTGWSMATLQFLFLTGLMGGVLAAALLLLRAGITQRDTLPRILRKKEPVPYGIAIAGGFLWLLWSGGIVWAMDV